MQGKFLLDDCPKDFVRADDWTAIEYARLYEKGLPPVAGGALDQTQIFADACRFIWSEQARWKNELGILF